jgi:hypothetical protein
MLKNYFKIALRNLLRNKGFSVINILGLAIGMASAAIILLWVQNEVSYDRFHEKDKHLFEIWENDQRDGGLQSGIPRSSSWDRRLRKTILKLKTPRGLDGINIFYSDIKINLSR